MLMIAQARLQQSDQSGRLPDVPAGAAFWARSADAAGLVAGGLAAYAPPGTQLRAEPPRTVNQIPGFAVGTSNASP
jgi:hypothetical protein